MGARRRSIFAERNDRDQRNVKGIGRVSTRGQQHPPTYVSELLEKEASLAMPRVLKEKKVR